MKKLVVAIILSLILVTPLMGTTSIISSNEKECCIEDYVCEIADSLYKTTGDCLVAVNYLDSIIEKSNITDTISILNHQINYFVESGLIKDALDRFPKLLICTQNIRGKSHPTYGDFKQYQAKLYFSLDSIDLAIEACKEALDIYNKTKIYLMGRNDNNPLIFDCYLSLAKYNGLSQNYETALKYIHKADSIGNLCFDKYDFEFSRLKYIQGNIYAENGLHNEALEYLKKSLEICRTNNISGEPLMDRLSSLFHTYIKLKDYQNAIKCNEESLAISRKLELYDYILAALEEKLVVTTYTQEERIVDSLIQDITNEISNYPFEVDKGYLINIYETVARHYFQNDEFIAAKKYTKKTLQLYTDIESEGYSYLKGMLANIYYHLEDIANAITLQEELLSHRIAQYGRYSNIVANSYNNLGVYYESIGRDDIAMSYAQEAFEIRDSILSHNDVLYHHSLGNISGTYLRNGRIDDAIRYQKYLYSLLLKHDIDGEVGNTLQNIGLSYLYTDSLKQAYDFISAGIKENKRLYSTHSKEYACGLSYLSKYYQIANDLKTALEYETQSLDIYQILYGCDDNRYLSRLYGIISLSYYLDLWDSFNYYLKLYHKYISEISINNLMGLNKQNQESYWNMQKSWYFNDLLVYASDTNATNELKQCAYNGLLLAKGLLLQIESLKDTENDSISVSNWIDVRNSLSKESIAIEFGTYNLEDTTYYVALLVAKDFESPKVVPLFEQSEFEKIDLDEYYTSKELSKLIWSPLIKYLDNYNNVYFSPHGVLHSISIESLQLPYTEGYVFDRWKLYRLSSTRELVKRHTYSNIPQVVLYGGLKYNSINDIVETNDIPTQSLSSTISDLYGLRAGYNYLQGTLEEVLYIDSLYVGHKIPTQLYTNYEGTETTLKNLSGKLVLNLHISTHGFYWNNLDNLKNNSLKRIPFITDSYGSTSFEDQAMSCSGLLFSCCNSALNGQRVDIGLDDGILTAKEVSKLDLSGLELLVLSACETGLGEISDDGVFGLQRGFKKAGVQSIVMSLWKVYDDATQKLMTEFYKNYLSGKSKRESLLNAQKVVRETPGWEDPVYWAGFILLDGLD